MNAHKLEIGPKRTSGFWRPHGRATPGYYAMLIWWQNGDKSSQDRQDKDWCLVFYPMVKLPDLDADWSTSIAVTAVENTVALPFIDKLNLS